MFHMNFVTWNDFRFFDFLSLERFSYYISANFWICDRFRDLEQRYYCVSDDYDQYDVVRIAKLDATHDECMRNYRAQTNETKTTITCHYNDVEYIQSLSDHIMRQLPKDLVNVVLMYTPFKCIRCGLKTAHHKPVRRIRDELFHEVLHKPCIKPTGETEILNLSFTTCLHCMRNNVWYTCPYVESFECIHCIDFHRYNVEWRDSEISVRMEKCNKPYYDTLVSSFTTEYVYKEKIFHKQQIFQLYDYNLMKHRTRFRPSYCKQHIKELLQDII